MYRFNTNQIYVAILFLNKNMNQNRSKPSCADCWAVTFWLMSPSCELSEDRDNNSTVRNTKRFIVFVCAWLYPLCVLIVHSCNELFEMDSCTSMVDCCVFWDCGHTKTKLSSWALRAAQLQCELFSQTVATFVTIKLVSATCYTELSPMQ